MSKRRRLLAVLLLLILLAPVGVFLAYGLAYHLYSLPRAAEEDFVSGFESGDFSEWDSLGAIQFCCEHSGQVVTDPVRAGSHAARFTIRKEDPDVRDGKRAELRLKGVEMGRLYRYAFSLYVPEDWIAGPLPMSAAQWHGTPDKLLGEAGRSPPLMLLILDEAFLVEVNWDPARITDGVFGPSGSQGHDHGWQGPLERGRWSDWVFTVRWSAGDDGLLEVEKDGRTLVRREGPNAYKDFIGPYMKLGIYSWDWADKGDKGARAAEDPARERSLYYDSVSVTAE